MSYPESMRRERLLDRLPHTVVSQLPFQLVTHVTIARPRRRFTARQVLGLMAGLFALGVLAGAACMEWVTL